MSAPGSIAQALVADAGTEAAPPRANGELVFAAPWESRAFAMAVALAERGTFPWEEFRGALIAEIGASEGAHDPAQETRSDYYERWLASLERVLLDRDLLVEAELAARVELLAEHDEHEHEHDHDHGHDHDHHGGHHHGGHELAP